MIRLTIKALAVAASASIALAAGAGKDHGLSDNDERRFGGRQHAENPQCGDAEKGSGAAIKDEMLAAKSPPYSYQIIRLSVAGT